MPLKRLRCCDAQVRKVERRAPEVSIEADLHYGGDRIRIGSFAPQKAGFGSPISLVSTHQSSWAACFVEVADVKTAGIAIHLDWSFIVTVRNLEPRFHVLCDGKDVEDATPVSVETDANRNCGIRVELGRSSVVLPQQ